MVPLLHTAFLVLRHSEAAAKLTGLLLGFTPLALLLLNLGLQRAVAILATAAGIHGLLEFHLQALHARLQNSLLAFQAPRGLRGHGQAARDLLLAFSSLALRGGPQRALHATPLLQFLLGPLQLLDPCLELPLGVLSSVVVVLGPHQISMRLVMVLLRLLHLQCVSLLLLLQAGFLFLQAGFEFHADALLLLAAALLPLEALLEVSNLGAHGLLDLAELLFLQLHRALQGLHALAVCSVFQIVRPPHLNRMMNLLQFGCNLLAIVFLPVPCGVRMKDLRQRRGRARCSQRRHGGDGGRVSGRCRTGHDLDRHWQAACRMGAGCRHGRHRGLSGRR
mmetsp:Transcript_13902/g.41509  ORF Transcript_13902/g.41509 Transcript_13902/m.41509 type:complete len:335 (-) Transcript_13902:575-1579(-)